MGKFHCPCGLCHKLGEVFAVLREKPNTPLSPQWARLPRMTSMRPLRSPPLREIKGVIQGIIFPIPYPAGQKQNPVSIEDTGFCVELVM